VTGAPSSSPTREATGKHLTTKTPYKPQQEGNYQPPPKGYSLVFIQHVARHGSRGLSSPDTILAVFDMVEKAKAEKALTSLGKEFEKDLVEMLRVNASLGEGDPFLEKAGFGNLSQRGILEHKETAARMVARHKAYFDQIAKRETDREFEYTSSGEPRAAHSAHSFVQSLLALNPALKTVVEKSDGIQVDPAATTKPAEGVDRFTLYFHKVNAKDDPLPAGHPFQSILDASDKYRSFAKGPEVKAKIKEVNESAPLMTASRALLERLFEKSFLQKIEDGTLSFTDAITVSVDGSKPGTKVTVTGEGEEKLASLTDAALGVYSVCAHAPGLSVELKGRDYWKYVTDAQGEAFAYASDAEDFYKKGPSISENSPVTFRMAQGLLDDFFKEGDDIASGDVSHAGRFRFAHAEVIIPFSALLGVEFAAKDVPQAETYSYKNNDWRGSRVSPYAANVQWEMYQDKSKTLLVKMLYNEKETAFKAACKSARIADGSFYYDYAKLKACYQSR
jgi:hypothetical protein